MQFSLFSAMAASPTLDDLSGVLLAGGHWVRHGGAARLSVVVADPWRADELQRAFIERGIADPEGPAPAEGGLSARTAFQPRLAEHAALWTRGANEGPPADLHLTAGALRLWAIAAGHSDPVGYVLGTEFDDDPMHRAGGAQLSRLGLAAVSITARAGGPGWRITSAKRLRRFADLVGVPPEGAGRDWPTAAG